MGKYANSWDIGSGSYKEYRNRNSQEIEPTHKYRDHMIKDYKATYQQEIKLAKKLNKDVNKLTAKQKAKAVIYIKCDGNCSNPNCNNGIIGGPQSIETHKNRSNSFYNRYGITSEELAKQEGVSSTALNMRHMKYGTVWQRKAKPTELERLFHKTQVELAHELGVHPVTVMARFKRYNTPYHVSKYEHPLKNKTMNYKVILFPECNDLRETRKDATAEYKIMFDKYVKKIGGIEWHYIKRNKQGGYDLYVKDIHEVDTHWSELPKYANSKFWLHPNHENYPHTERAGL